ncbi:MAG: hypothetical protein HC774_02405 [Sphingomonadales bacterium]|nr:hypothetical protein [Sphingomonadales bacterium]
MNFGGPNFVIALAVICTFGWVLNNWIRARHGYPLEDEWGGKTAHPSVPADQQLSLLSNENADLKGKILRLEERVAVLERIATDTGTRLARDIDALR